MWAVVPVKDLKGSKRRLADCLSPEQRIELVRAMLEDVLTALAAVPSLEGTMVVTPDPQVEDLVAGNDVVVLMEGQAGGLNRALETAAAQLARLGASGILVVPADVPTVEAREISTIVDYHSGPPPHISVVPDRHREGTNCLASSPVDLCSFHFGPGSFVRHLEMARLLRVEPRELDLPGLRLDVDTREDLHLLAARENAGRSGALLSRLPMESILRQPSAMAMVEGPGH